MIADLLAKNGKPFGDGKLVHECMKTVLPQFIEDCNIDKQAGERLMRQINNMPLSRFTMTRRTKVNEHNILISIKFHFSTI